MAIALLITVTILYAGYNLFVKLSSGHLPAETSTTILLTICLQVVALTTSLIFAMFLYWGGGQTFAMTPRAYGWAALAGACIGGAEIAYFYLFSGLGQGTTMAASTVIPIVVSGTIIITVLISYPLFRESLSWVQLAGAALILLGINLLFFGRSTPLV